MKSCCFSQSATSPSCTSVNLSDATFALFLGWLSEGTCDGGGVTSLLRLRLRLRLTASSSECSDGEFETEDGGVTSFPFFFFSTTLPGMRFPLGGIFYLLSCSIFCLVLSSVFFYLLSSSIFCLFCLFLLSNLKGWLAFSIFYGWLISLDVVCSVAFCK